MSLKKLLYDGAKKVGIELDEENVLKFLLFLDLLTLWNNKLNLTSITEDDDIIKKHFLDSLTVSKFLKRNSLVLDIGSGGGFPGIPLAIVDTSSEFTLMDSSEKKVVFMKEVVRKLGIKNINVINGRAEDANNSLERYSFDHIVVRAVGEIHKVLNYSLPYISEHGTIILMRGKNGEEELQDYLDSSGKLVQGLSVEKIKSKIPFSDFERVVLVFNKK